MDIKMYPSSGMDNGPVHGSVHVELQQDRRMISLSQMRNAAMRGPDGRSQRRVAVEWEHLRVIVSDGLSNPVGDINNSKLT
jgi:hypothetical protein